MKLCRASNVRKRFSPPAGAIIRHGATWRTMPLAAILLQMPPFETFRDAESYYAMLAHETATG